MRIIGGVARGRHIYSPKKSYIRPTSDGIKESIFNILQEVSGKSFLDLFAGSGNVGLEALSRGAARVVFVEKNAVMVNAIKKNLEELGFRNKCEILATEVKKGIRQIQKKGESFDFLYADPPYDKGYVEEILWYLREGNIVSSESLIILQHSLRESLPVDRAGIFILTDQRRYGDTLISFFRRNVRKEGTCI
jgi:16S rRNA (guanine966-N2)-methyltransferase